MAELEPMLIIHGMSMLKLCIVIDWHDNKVIDWHDNKVIDWHDNKVSDWHDNEVIDWHDNKVVNWHDKMIDWHDNKGIDWHDKQVICIQIISFLGLLKLKIFQDQFHSVGNWKSYIIGTKC